MALINTTRGPMDALQLIKRDGLVDNDNEHTTTVEYCLLDCPGEAHRTGLPDSDAHFCSLHVHRSAYVTLKKPVTLEGVAASFA